MRINCLVIIFGYDHNLTSKYKHYLDRAIKIIKSNWPELILTTGSYEGNRKDFTDEAAFIASYLKQHNIAGKIITDSNGLTTLQNLKDAKEMLVNSEITAKRIIIFCEGARCCKVKILSYLVFKRKLEFGCYELIEERRARIYEKYWNTPYDILGYFLNFLEKRKIAERKNSKK